jgi:hypothetical protein
MLANQLRKNLSNPDPIAPKSLIPYEGDCPPEAVFPIHFLLLSSPIPSKRPYFRDIFFPPTPLFPWLPSPSDDHGPKRFQPSHPLLADQKRVEFPPCLPGDQGEARVIPTST